MRGGGCKRTVIKSELNDKMLNCPKEFAMFVACELKKQVSSAVNHDLKMINVLEINAIMNT